LTTGAGSTAAAEAAFSWSAWAGILLAFVSLGFNVWNALRTTRIQENVRLTTVQLAQFEKLRAPVDACLADLSKEQLSLRSLEASGRSIGKIIEAVQESNKKIGDVDSQISTALKKLDESNFANGRDWASQYGSDYDGFVAVLNGAYNPTDVDEKRLAAIKNSSEKLELLIKNVHQRIEAEVERISGSR
jgi:hypothetical protein